MRALFVHPSPLMYSEIFLRLEPLGLERVAAAARAAGHDVRVVDLQVFGHDALERELRAHRPEVVGFGLNYLANVPEVLDLAQAIKRRLPGCFTFAGGHSVSFIADHVLEQSRGGLDAVIRGDGEAVTPLLLAAVAARRGTRAAGDRGFCGPAGDGAPALATSGARSASDAMRAAAARAAELPGVVTREGRGSGPPLMLDSIDECPPARDLMRARKRYFIGELDPCASIELTRGCPWDCSFCSAWTFYGRAYRKASPAAIASELESIREPSVFIVDDVAFIKEDHGEAIAREVERRGVRKRYYLETRADVLLRNTAVFERWRKLGLAYMFLGIEALDEQGLELYRKRVSPDVNTRALETARALGITVAMNLIVDPQWDEERFRLVREFALSVPEIVHLTVMTPYPGTEIWPGQARKLTTRDYRLFDIQHAVLPTKLPLDRFYAELVKTQGVINRKHLGVRALAATAGIVARQLAHGQTNFLRMLWRFNSVYNASRQRSEHERPVRYELPLPPPRRAGANAQGRTALYIHQRKPAAAGSR